MGRDLANVWRPSERRVPQLGEAAEVFPSEWQPAGEKGVQRHASGIHFAAHCAAPALQYLGCSDLWVPTHGRGPVPRSHGSFTEVAESRVAIGVKEDVGGLHVAV